MIDSIKLINNEGYGAPELKRLYQGFTMKGLIIAVSIHLVFIGIYMLVGYIGEAKSKELDKKYERKYKIVEIDVPPPVTDNEIPPAKDVTEKVKDLSRLTPEPVRKDISDDVVLKTQDELNNLPDVNAGREGDSLVAANNNNLTTDITDDITTTKIIPDEPVKKIYKDFEVEKPPVCLNLAQVNSSMKYPELAAEIGKEGRVSVKVLVGTDGSVVQVGPLTGPADFYEEVRDKVVNLQFTPGLQNNSPVKVWVTVPFVFRLK